MQAANTVEQAADAMKSPDAEAALNTTASVAPSVAEAEAALEAARIAEVEASAKAAGVTPENPLVEGDLSDL